MHTKLQTAVLILGVAVVACSPAYACYPPNYRPVAYLEAVPEAVLPDVNVTLDGSASYDSDGSIVKYEWDWTNDSSYDYNETPGDGKAEHSYASPGIYTAKLRVTDNDSATDTDTCTIYVIETYYVSTDGNDDANGLSWPTAFATIQHALDVTGDCNIIEVNEGTYYETINFNGISCTLTSTNPNDWDITAKTIIDGNDPSANVVTLQNSENANCQLKGFTITGGARGIYCDGASPAISNCVITDNNTGAADGGGIYDCNSSLTITNCFIVENDANCGGGIYDFNSLPTLTNCVFSNNTARTHGGGIYTYESSTKLTNCTFSKNDACDYGGGIYNYNSVVILTNCIVWGNTASDGNSVYYNDINYPSNQNFISWWKFDETSGTTAEDSVGDNNGTLVNGPVWTTGQIGGGLSFSGGDDYVDCGSSFASVTRSATKTITAWAKSDVSDRSGRIITLYRSSTSDSAFVISLRENDGGNPATWQGLYATPGHGYKLIDSEVPVTAGEWTHIALVQDGTDVHIYVDGELKNSANDATTPTMVNPPHAVIGTYMWYGHGPSASFLGTIDDVRIYKRALNTDEILALAGCARYSDIQGCGSSKNWDPNFGNDGGGNIDADPEFVSPADLDGIDNVLATIDDGLQLSPTSPCVDAGDDSAASGITKDITGVTDRELDGDNDSDPVVDMGAYEFDPDAESVWKLRISGGEFHTLLIKMDGTLWACGDNRYYQLGIGNTQTKLVIVQVEGKNGVGHLEDIILIDAGWMHSLAVELGGKTWGWGYNTSGQVGDGTRNVAMWPTDVVGGDMGTQYLQDIYRIAAGRSGEYSLACDDQDRHAYGWGKNSHYQLGIGSDSSNQLSPKKVHGGEQGGPYLENIIEVDAGIEHSIFLDNGGYVWTVGDNYTGQLGNGYQGTGQNKQEPVKVVGPNGIGSSLGNIVHVAVTPGEDGGSSIALDYEGHVWTWGWGYYGQLGNGNYFDSPIPVQVVGGDQGGEWLEDITAISAGVLHVLALDKDGNVWAWGRNLSGVLGVGQYVYQSPVPLKVKKLDGSAYLSDIIYIDAGYGFSLAIDRYGTFWGWGGNICGMLSLGHIDTQYYAQQMITEPQANQYCENAIDIGIGETDSGYTYLASEGSVWYSHTADSTAWVTISLCDSTFDTMLTLWDQCNGAILDSNDNFCGSQSELTYHMQADETYLIEVSGALGEQGMYTLSID